MSARAAGNAAGRSRVAGQATAASAAPAVSATADGAAALLALDSGRFLRPRGGAGTTVTAVSGMLWVTRDGCWDDVLLEPGEQYALVDDTPVLVGAFGPSVARVSEPRRLGQGWRTAAGRLFGRCRLALTGI
jgi:hypothetical protein